jgi:uncharacterized repeat protein (TIGR02543 family)
VTANITVYAKWTVNTVSTYTVIFNKNGGTTDANPTNTTVFYGGTVTLPTTNPTWASRAFLGWWTANGSGGNWGTEFTASTAVTANITVYAKWDPPPDAYYTIIFNKNGGDTEAAPTSRTAAPGGTVTLPSTPLKTGYTFGGWYTSTDGGTTLGTEFTAITVVTANITVYAKWTINTYTVSFDKNSGNTEANPANGTTTYNGTVTLPTTNPTWANRAFLGWWTGNGQAATGARNLLRQRR